jgi:hypothetical protein
MNNYTMINPPFSLNSSEMSKKELREYARSLNFSEMSKKELREYARWYHEVMPERLDILIHAVHATPGFETWQPDYTPSSLERLGEWYAGQVETRPRTQDEIDEIKSRLTFQIEIASYELTDRTYSLAYDVGMYLSQVFMKNHESLRWDQPLGSKRDINYGQPVLMGFGAVPFNTVGMLVTQASGIVTGHYTGKKLRELYDIWKDMIG